jgi:hypothetical protein
MSVMSCEHRAQNFTLSHNYLTYIYIYNQYSFINYSLCGSAVVKALCYKPEGRGFHTRWSEFLNLPKPSGRTRPWGLFSLTEMRTRCIKKIIMFLGNKVRRVRKVDNPTAIYDPIV